MTENAPPADRPESRTRYEVMAASVAGHPRGTILRADQLLPLSGTIPRLLEVGAIRPVREDAAGLYGVSLVATRRVAGREPEVCHMAWALRADSDADAMGRAGEVAARFFPPAEGYSGVDVSLVGIAARPDGSLELRTDPE